MGLRSTGAWLGLVEHDDEPIYAEPPPGEAYDDEDQPAGQEALTPGFQIAAVEPQNFGDARTVGEYFRQDVPVIINLHGMDGPDAKRIVDFASGLAFGRRGSIERLSSRVFLLLPPGGSIVKGHGPLAEEGFFNQA